MINVGLLPPLTWLRTRVQHFMPAQLSRLYEQAARFSAGSVRRIADDLVSRVYIFLL